MSNKIKLENPLQPVHVRLTEGVQVLQGDGSDRNYVHNQSTTSFSWEVNHNLNKYCSVTVVDNTNNVVIGEIYYESLNKVVLSFSAAFSGKAFCN